MSDIDKMVEKEEHQSKIVSFKIENFMSIKNALLEFDDSNVISLCGYNDSGKSAITRLFEIMFYNEYSLDQVRFITDGEEYWLGALTFSDGVVYTRIKYSDGKSLWELKKGDKVLFTNRLPNDTLAAMSDIPEVITKYLGVIQEELTGEELNVRRNTDKLFLINTSGGDNYKILNSVLRSDVLSNASKRLNDDKNKLNNEVSEKTTIKNVLEEQYSSYDVPPKDEIDELKSYITVLDDYKGRVLRTSSIMEECATLHSISLYDKLDTVDTVQLVDMQNILSLREDMNVSIYDTVVGVDVERLAALQTILGLRKDLDVSTYDSLESVDTGRLKSLIDLGNLYNAYSVAQKSVDTVSKQLQKVQKDLKTLSAQYNLKVCPNCGAVVA